MELVRSNPERARFTARLVFFEEPELAEKLVSMAEESGHSVAAEIRGAVRFWINSFEARDD